MRSRPASQPYGSWSSPITADLIVAETIGLGGVVLDGNDVYWSESRPTEGGRNAVMRRSASGAIKEVLPPPFSARTRVNEYGGGAFAVTDGVLYFANDADRCVYRRDRTGKVQALTPADARRYADFAVDRTHGRLIAVCEDHRRPGEPTHTLVAIDLRGAREPVTLASGRDFYSSPRLNADDSELAFLAWDHPAMPWDQTGLYIAGIARNGTLQRPRRVAGNRDESVFQPSYGPDGALYFVSDISDWWNLYRHADGATRALLPMAAEFGAPQWVFGLSTYAFVAQERIVCANNQQGTWHLGALTLTTGAWQPIATPYTDIGYVCARSAEVFFIGAGPVTSPELARLDLASGTLDVIRRSASRALDSRYISIPRAIEFPTTQGEQAHAFYYRPCNPSVAPPAHERPPLIVITHGGPTAAATSALNLRVQYWTSRGFAVLDLNYRGSTGFGRAYRRRLDGEWGIADVADCIEGARYLVAQGEVDGVRLAIRGSSAGGFTTLCALTFHDVFKAGAVYYGISDLTALAHDTHKFESRYLERLVGPYPAERERYRARSPIHFADRLCCPVIFFQGAEDRVVPPDQTERLAKALHARGIPVAYMLFTGEQHGFRRAENVKRALETELHFYGRVFGFATDADDHIAEPLF